MSGFIATFGFATEAEADADVVTFRGRPLRLGAFCTPTSCERSLASCRFRIESVRLLRRAALRISRRLVLNTAARFVRRSMVPTSSMTCAHWSGDTAAAAAEAFARPLEVAVVATGADASAEASASAVSPSSSVSTSLVVEAGTESILAMRSASMESDACMKFARGEKGTLKKNERLSRHGVVFLKKLWGVAGGKNSRSERAQRRGSCLRLRPLFLWLCSKNTSGDQTLFLTVFSGQPFFFFKKTSGCVYRRFFLKI